MSDKKLTSQSYWETYYKAQHTEKQHITNVCSYYNQFWETLFLDKKNNSTLLEIGGYPGRYLAYLADKYKVHPTCLDFNSNTSQVEETFKTMGVEDFEIIQADFTKHKSDKLYDYVISNGFIEHFENYDQILDLHVSYLNNKGKLLVMIPNMKGYIKFYKTLVDKANLEVHNLECMSLDVFKNFADRHNLKVNHLSYFGGFPFNVHQKLNVFQNVIFKAHHFLFKRFINKRLALKPSKYFSTGIIAIFEKP